MPSLAALSGCGTCKGLNRDRLDQSMDSSAVKKTRAPRTKKVAVSAPTVVSPTEKQQQPVPALFVEEVEAAPMPPVAATVAKKTKKSSGSAARKPPVVATVTPDGIIGSLTTIPEPRPLIAHLPIRLNDIETDLFVGKESGGNVIELTSSGGSMVMPFDSTEQFASFGGAESSTIPPPPAVTAEETPIVPRPSLPLHYSEKLMMRFLDSNRDQRLPESTDVACFWDCHQFRGTPCVIPVKIEEDIWHVYGNFCCPECATAYLFQERLDTHVQWERYALLNRLYAGGGMGTVRLAGSRTVLRLFGGNLDITEYRSLMAEKRMRIDVTVPPMISITQVMDTKPIDFYDASVKNTFIPWEMDRMNRPGAQGLRLRRTKPIARKEATLEWCMGISPTA